MLTRSLTILSLHTIYYGIGAIVMKSCMYNNTGPIQILPDKTIGQLYFRDSVEIQFDVQLSTTPCSERFWCHIFSIGSWHRLPLVYIASGEDVSYRYALVYEMRYSRNNLRDYYTYPKDGNTTLIDGKKHNLYCKFTLTSTLIILDHNITIVNETISERDNWYFGTHLPIMAVWNNPPYTYPGLNGTIDNAGVWNGTITNLHQYL